MHERQSVKLNQAAPLKLGGTEDLYVGSWVGSIGHGSGGIWTFNTGMVSNIYPAGSERPIFQTQIPLNPGSSGGPIFDRQGRVVGVVTAGEMESNNVNFGIKIDLAFQYLSRLESLCACLTVSAPQGVPVFLDGVMVGKGPKLLLRVPAGNHSLFVVKNGQMVKQLVNYPKQRIVDLH